MSANGKVRLWELPASTTYIIPKRKTYDRFRQSLKKRYSRAEIEKRTGLPQSVVGGIYLYDRVALSTIKKLSRLEEFKKIFPRRFEDAVEWIGTRTGKGIRDPKLPFELKNSAGACFIAAVLGDGTIKRGGGVSYTNTKKAARKKIMEASREIFGGIELVEDPAHYTVNFPTIAGRILARLGLRGGAKGETNPRVPFFIRIASEDVKKEFLKQFFTDEGTVSSGKSAYYVGLKLGRYVDKRIFGGILENPQKNTKWAPELLKDVKAMLGELEIGACRIHLTGKRVFQRDGTTYFSTYWGICVQRRNNLIRYQQLVGFSDNDKEERLTRLLRKLKNDYVRCGLERAIANVACVENEKGYVDKYLLSKQSGFSRRWGEKWLSKLAIGGYLRTTERSAYIRGGELNKLQGKTLQRYRMTKKARKVLDKLSHTPIFY
ncbi:MAG: hypothetical protein ABH829_04890 [archaeon]